MDDDELHARFAGLRVALAYAIKVASRSAADLGHHRDALREIETLLRPSAHPAIKEELDGVIAALTRLPVRDPSHGSEAVTHPRPILPSSDRDPPADLLS